MLESILKFNKKNFYQEKVDAIDGAIRKYAHLKLRKADNDAISSAKNDAQQLIASIIDESGFSGQGNVYVAIDKEFFTDKGVFDEESLRQFQKEVVKHYGIQQIKWSFAGTTLNFTHITKRALHNQGVAYEELLPHTILKEEQEEKLTHYKGDNPNSFNAFLYSDGTVSEQILPEKMKVRFDNLKDLSGFNWNMGYSPDNQVKKQDWAAGFNKQGVWEKFLTISGEKSNMIGNSPYQTSDNQTIDSNLINGIHSKGSLSKSRKQDGIKIIQYGDSVYLLDDFSSLYQAVEEYYYSITGEIYGARQVDREKSLKLLKNNIRKKGINTLTGVVIHRASKSAVKFYKNALADFVTKKTQFYSQNDKAIHNTLSHLRTAIEGEEVSNQIIVDLFNLSTRGVKQEELYQNLKNANDSRILEIPLHIFENKSDLETFLMLPAIQEICEPGIAEFLKELKVPEEKRGLLSHAVQNLLYNYKNIFKHKQVKQMDVMRAAKDLIVDNKRSTPILNTKVTAEDSLYDTINNAAGGPGTFNKTSVFITNRAGKEYYDLFTEQGRLDWIQEELVPVFPDQTIDVVKNTLKTMVIPETEQNKFSLAVQNIFPIYSSIAQSTGSTPLDIIKHIESVLLDKTEAQTFKRKRIFFEKSIKDVIEESSKAHVPGIKTEKRSLFGSETVHIVWKPFTDEINLFEEKDLAAFLSSPLIEESGFSKDTAFQIGEYVKSVSIPGTKQKEFSGGLLNIIRGYELQLKPSGISLMDAVRALEDHVHKKRRQKNKHPIGLRTLRTVRKVARLGDTGGSPGTQDIVVNVDYGKRLKIMLENGLESFLSSPIVTQGNVPKDDAAKIFQYVKESSLPVELEQNFARAVIGTLNMYGTISVPDSINAFDLVKAATSYITGKKVNIGENMQHYVDEVLTEVPFSGSSSYVIPFNNTEDPIFDSLNLLRPEDFDTFIQSDIFKTSGLQEDQLHSLIDEYRRAYTQNKKMESHIVTSPLQYNDDTSLQQPDILKNIASIFSSNPSLNTLKNSVFNVGFSVKTFPEQDPVIFITNLGKKTLSGRKTNGEQDNVMIEFARDMIFGQSKNLQGEGGDGTDYPYLFTHSLTPVKHKKNTSSFFSNQSDTASVQKKTRLSTNESTTMDAGMTRHQRIENNYNNDKRMLARSSSESLLGKSSQTKKTKSADEENVIKQMSDDLVEEMMNKAKEEGL